MKFYGFLLATCALSSTVHCVILKGLGNKRDPRFGDVVTGTDVRQMSERLFNLFPDLCDSKAIANYDTNNHAYDSPTLSRIACKAFNSNPKATHRVVFSISMGNLIFASALHQKKCNKTDHDFWVSQVAPWKGNIILVKINSTT